MTTDNNLYVSEVFINRDKGYRFGESEVYEAYTDDVKRLFRSMQREYGRCESAVYVDEGGKTKRVGWVFSKKMQYEDCADTYTREVWVTLHDAPDTVTVEPHYHALA